MQLQTIQAKIHTIRGQKIILDYDLASLYQTETRVLKQAVRRNMDRFPPDFMFQLSREEYHSLRSQSVILESGKGKYSKYEPFAFTEQGVAMLSSVLQSAVAVQVNISVMRAFVHIRQLALSHQELTEQLKKLEEKYDHQFANVYEALNYLITKDDEESKAVSERSRIGFRLTSDSA